jgi:hypothetical protein
MNNVKVKGVRDLMWENRLQWKHIAKEMITSGVPGNWDKPQNIYNLVNGDIVPKDAYVYIALSKIFNTDISIILSRYTSVNDVEKALDTDSFNDSIFGVPDKLKDFDDEDLF